MAMDYITLVDHEKEITQEQYEAKFPKEWARIREIAGEELLAEESKDQGDGATRTFVGGRRRTALSKKPLVKEPIYEQA